jgi:DNA-binding transcriptional MerR regulator
MAYTVGEVARLAGVTNRTLHHYDEIGLLQPQERSSAGYRLYGAEDLQRLQEILYYRELGFGLDEIKAALDGPEHDRGTALRRQRSLLLERIARLELLVESLEVAIRADEKGLTMNKQDMFEVFGDFNPADYEEEVEQRWSGPALDESRRRTSSYTKEDWKALGAESEAIARRFAELHAAGVAPKTPEAMDTAEEHRLHIDRWFYPCSREMHAGLGEMYIHDARFAAHWNGYEEGLAEFVSAAIIANAHR